MDIFQQCEIFGRKRFVYHEVSLEYPFCVETTLMKNCEQHWSRLRPERVIEFLTNPPLTNENKFLLFFSSLQVSSQYTAVSLTPSRLHQNVAQRSNNFYK